jgi:hypothetical protein
VYFFGGNKSLFACLESLEDMTLYDNLKEIEVI